MTRGARSALAIAAAAVSVGAVAVPFVLRRQRDARAREVEPALAIARGGAAVAAWMRVPHEDASGEGEEDAADAIAVRIVSSRGARPVALAGSHDGRLVADPALVALPDGAVLLTWLAFRENLKAHGEAYDMRVLAARIDPETGLLSPARSVAGDAPDHDYDRPWPAVTNAGRVVVAYRFAHAGDGGIAVAVSHDGITWARRELFATFGFGGGLVTTCASAPGSHVYVVYFDPTRGVRLRVSHDDAERFLDIESGVSAPDENVADEAPSCFASGDDVVVAYGIGAGPNDSGASALLDHVVVARSRDAGRTFSEGVIVRAPGRFLMHPRTTADGAGGFAVATYVLEAKEDHAAELRLFRGRFADGDALRSRIVARGLRLAARRGDVAWPGDYLGFAVEHARAEVAFVDATSGAPRVVLSSPTLEP